MIHYKFLLKTLITCLFLISCSSEPTEEITMYGFILKIEHGQFIINGDLIGYEGNGRPYEFPNGVVITKNYRQVNNGRFIEGYYPGGTQIEISVQPQEGYGFVGWEGIESNESVLIIENTNFNLKTICLPSICPDEDCWVKLYTDFEPDPNGYHHVTPQWDNESSGRFNIHIESAPTTKQCQYGGVPRIISSFNSDTYWEVESGLSFTFGLYNPFNSLYTQQGDIIKVKDTIVTLDYFQGTIIPIVQETSIRHDVKDKMECYGWTNPDSGPTFYETGNCTMYSKRIVGPLIREMIGDTIKIYSETYFDCGQQKPGINFGQKPTVRDSISVIIN